MDNYDIIEEYHEDYLYLLEKYSFYGKPGMVFDENVKNSYITKDCDDDLRILFEKYNLARFYKRNEKNRFAGLVRLTWMMLANGHASGHYSGRERAMDILAYSVKDRVLVNCRQYAVVLTELLLALGEKARVLCCMPPDLYPSENHTMSVVYSTELEGWIPLDAANCCMFEDEKGKPLTVNELRKRLAASDEIWVNNCFRDRDRGQRVSPMGSQFRHYLVKNFFRFYINVTEFGENKPEIILHLIPDGFLSEGKKMMLSGDKRMLYTTSNQEWFWNAM
ncbi:MAG: hypothetical protein HUJ69_06440 [Lachnospiraceae bacterium]|nr:hypothetical protein [Lachnospiraceae bacterium]